MVRLDVLGLVTAMSIGLVTTATMPFQLAFHALGWLWLLWTLAVTKTMAFAIYQSLPARTD